MDVSVLFTRMGFGGEKSQEKKNIKTLVSADEKRA